MAGAKKPIKRGNARIKKKRMIAALGKSLGIITPALQSVGISSKTHYEWLRNDPEYKLQVESINDIVIDFVESELFKKIKGGAEKSIHFYLRHKARDRGYIQTTDVNMDTNVRVINVKIEDEDDEPTSTNTD